MATTAEGDYHADLDAPEVDYSYVSVRRSPSPPFDAGEVCYMHVTVDPVFVVYPYGYVSDLLGLRTQFCDSIAASSVGAAALALDGAGPSHTPSFGFQSVCSSALVCFVLLAKLSPHVKVRVLSAPAFPF